jgi:hypothetical protein
VIWNRQIRISDVFNGLGQPGKTYVAQENGAYENLLRSGIESGGKLCLLTGSSKTGKTTLYRKILQERKLEALVVRCDETLNAEDFWRCPLEIIDFRRIQSIEKSQEVETSGEAKIGGTIGWNWLAGLIGEITLGVKENHSETKIREKILARPSPSHLIPLLKKSNAFLVVEDFHYLSEETQRQIFQQWKVFTDEQVSVIVVGTTHHASDLAYANPDLLGRIMQIDLKRWVEDDLKKIALKGFEFLEIVAPMPAVQEIARESVGLPIIMQQTCAQLFINKGYYELKKGDSISKFSKMDAYLALHKVASTGYAQFEDWYEKLVTGARKKARRYNTYEFVLSTFIQDPLKFSLKRHELDERLNKLPVQEDKLPPAGSITSTLNAITGIQKRSGFELLEWSQRNKTLYVLEPAFLFYLRWRQERQTSPTILETLSSIISNIFGNDKVKL